MLRFNLAASAVSVCLLAGCQLTPSPVAQPAPVAAAPEAAAPVAVAQAPVLDASVASVSVGDGPHAGLVTIAPAKGYQALAVTGSNPVHRWVAADVFQYDVALDIWNGTTWVSALAAPLVVSKTQTQALFSNLAASKRYRARVTARGNKGGLAATTNLNAVPVDVELDFTANQDLNRTLTTTVQVTLDNVAFSGEATITVGAPVDGAYNQPEAVATGTALP